MKKDAEHSFSPRLLDAAVHYDWPGNLRELRNFVTRTIILRDQDSAVRELEKKIAAADDAALQEGTNDEQLWSSGMKSIVREVKNRTEAQIIQKALDASGWNRRHAAQYLDISYRGLLYKIQQHRLTPATSAARIQ